MAAIYTAMDRNRKKNNIQYTDRQKKNKLVREILYFLLIKYSHKTLKS